MNKSNLEAELVFQLESAGIPDFVCEHRFHPTRRWRFDIAWPEIKLAVEVEGGIYTHGRHTRGVGFEQDLRKYAAAMELGWNIYRCSGNMIKSGEALDTIEKLIDLSNG